ncbi:MAG: hypothetical protein AAB375_03395, partial [Patescibacteria group bacterium]
GIQNTANGYAALYSNTTGAYNTANGFQALYSNTTGTDNTANGLYALYSNTTGGNNTANGMYALYSNTTGNSNTANGYQAGYGTTANHRSVIDTQMVLLGMYASRLDTVASTSAITNGIAIGYGAKVPGSNTAVLGNDSILTTLLKGNVGINTTAPAAKLDVAGDLQINISSSSGAANSFALCHTSNGATSDQFVIDCGNAPSADYMEMYPTTPDIEEGEIMVPSSTSFVLDTRNNKVPKLVRSSRPYQQGIIGITSIASQAGDFNSIGYNIQSTNDNPQQTRPLALSGRVLLKVSTDNGPIRVGDRITSSNLPGIGMKATTAGMTVGTALEATTDNLQLTTGDYQKIMVFVGAQYWAPEVALPEAISTEASSSAGNADWIHKPFQSLFGMIVDAFRSMFGIVFERGKVQAEQLCAGTVCVNQQQLQQLLDSSGVTVPPVAETPTPAPSQADESAPTPSETPSESSPTPVPDTPTPIPDIPTPTPDASPPAEPIPTGTP